MISTNPLLVLVPALNEQETIRDVVGAIRAEQFDVLVIDDGSTDETAQRAEAEGATVLRLPVNLGVGGALRTGFRYAVENNYSAVVQVDADGQHPVTQIHELISAASRFNAHLVVGSRYLAKGSALNPTSARRLAMRILGWQASVVAKAKITDSTSGFRIICRPLLDDFAVDFPQYYLGDTIEATIIAARNGYRITEIPASLSPRRFGKSTISDLQAILMIMKVMVLVILRLTKARRKS